jgi:hypothetical protein
VGIGVSGDLELQKQKSQNTDDTELHGNYTDKPTAQFAYLCCFGAIGVIRVPAVADSPPPKLS